jgi:hypothetical protein
MDCERTRELIDAWNDRQLSSEDAAAVQSHLDLCAECQALAESSSRLDADLLRAFQPHREAAYEVARRVLNALDEKPQQNVVIAPAKGRVWPLLLTTAAGFLLATFLYQPWKEEIAQPLNIVAEQGGPKPVAEIVAATGTVEVREAEKTDWKVCSNPYACHPGSAIRTGPEVLCELKTSDGCVVRMNDRTEVTLKAADSVEIERGQIWCSAPDDVSLKIVAAEKPNEKKNDRNKHFATVELSAFCCPSGATLAKVQPEGPMQVTTAHGETELQTPTSTQRLRQGETASIVDNQIVKSAHPSDLILATAWIHPLLIQKGRDDQELSHRVNALLAKIGQSKLDELYEREILGLGEYAVLPLLRYVQSPISEGDPSRRLKAIRILSESAPGWAIPELIPLLSDNDAEARFYIARALERLTGLNQGREPGKWRESPEACQPSVDLWKQWWAENRDGTTLPASRRKI